MSQTGTRAGDIRIAAVVSALDFVPGVTARALALSRSNTIDGMIPTFDQALFACEMTELAGYLSEHGHALIIPSGNSEPAQEFDLVRKMISRNVDGLFLVGIDRSPQVCDLPDRKQTPNVTAGTIDRDSPHPSNCV